MVDSEIYKGERMNYNGKIIIGALLVLVGINLVLQTGGYGFQINLDGWWTLFLIVPSAVAIKEGRAQLGNVIGLVVGILLLLRAQGILPSFGDYFFPVLLIIFGGWMVLDRSR